MQARQQVGAASITGFVQRVTLPGGHFAPDTFMILLTDYHGQYHGDLARDVSPGEVGVEVRFVRQYLPHG